MAIRSIKQMKALKGKVVLVRVGYDVPLDDKLQITDDARIRATIPTIKFLASKGARTVLLSHLGRPEGKDQKLSLKPVVPVLQKLAKLKLSFVPKTRDFDAELKAMKDGDVLLLENIRYEPGEDAKSPEYPALCEYYAKFADIFVNEAFSVSHRASASMVGIPKRMQELKKPACVGLQMLEEIEMLTPLLKPKGFSVAIVGGAKVKDKIGTIKTLVKLFSKVLIGGGMANTFLVASGKSVGKSKVEEEFIPEVKELLKNPKIVIPVDGVLGRLKDPAAKITSAVPSGSVNFAKGSPAPDTYVLDVDAGTVALFALDIKKANTVFWNGPLGVFETEAFRKGTYEVGKAVAACKGFTVVGGGDSAAAIELMGLKKKIKWVSTGGGAAQEFVEKQGHLPAVDVLL